MARMLTSTLNVRQENNGEYAKPREINFMNFYIYIKFNYVIYI